MCTVHALLAELKASCKSRDICRGRQVHVDSVAFGHAANIYLSSALIEMYSKCGSMVDAHRVFETIECPDVVSWTVLIVGYAENGQGFAALDLFRRMKCRGLEPDPITLVAALKACISLGETSECSECRNRGKELHYLAVEHGCDSNMKVQNTLVDMYAKTGSMVDAQQMFDSVKHPDVVTWTVLILGYADNGQGWKALKLFTTMKCRGPVPNSVTLVAALKACISIGVKQEAWVECKEQCEKIYNLAVETGWASDVHVQSTLINVYAKCGRMVEAHQLLQRMKHPNVVAWNALILGYAENGQAHTALEVFRTMASGGHLTPDPLTFVAVLKAAAKCGADGLQECKDRGKEIHNLAVEKCCDSDIYVQTTLIDLYGKCGFMVNAHQVFQSMQCPSVVAWNALILGYADNGQSLTALDLFKRMRTAPNSVTFLAVFKACGLAGGLEFGRTVHSGMHSRELDVVMVNCLVDFYGKCGSMVEARRVFDHARTRNVVTWTALLVGYSSSGDHKAVFDLFQRMLDCGFLPDCITFVGILACCSHSGLVEKAKECFDSMSSKYGIAPSVEHYTCLVDAFGRSNQLENAMALLGDMPQSPNFVTWTSVLTACHKWKNVEIGRLAFQTLIHLKVMDSTVYVLMAHVYGSRGMLQEQEMVMRMSKNPKMKCKNPKIT